MKKDLRASWPQALFTFFAPALLVLGIRWIVIEPFVVPSGSMIPTLLIHDHIFANKLAYGVHVPFEKKWLLHWSNPQRGDIAVFRYPETPDVFFVKRIVGIPGDSVAVENGILSVNGKKQEQTEAAVPAMSEGRFHYFNESGHLVRYLDRENSNYQALIVPEEMYFAMGDNRDQSSDSRVWGLIPEENFVGSVRRVWLACEKTLVSASFLCDPSTIRWNRILREVR